jgi:hypothetical protein
MRNTFEIVVAIDCIYANTVIEIMLNFSSAIKLKEDA